MAPSFCRTNFWRCQTNNPKTHDCKWLVHFQRRHLHDSFRVNFKFSFQTDDLVDQYKQKQTGVMWSTPPYLIARTKEKPQLIKIRWPSARLLTNSFMKLRSPAQTSQAVDVLPAISAAFCLYTQQELPSSCSVTFLPLDWRKWWQPSSLHVDGQSVHAHTHTLPPQGSLCDFI